MLSLKNATTKNMGKLNMRIQRVDTLYRRLRSLNCWRSTTSATMGPNMRLIDKRNTPPNPTNLCTTPKMPTAALAANSPNIKTLKRAVAVISISDIQTGAAKPIIGPNDTGEESITACGGSDSNVRKSFLENNTRSILAVTREQM